MAALELLERLDTQNRLPSPVEQGVLARWSGWGSLPHVFDDSADHDAAALRARELLPERARRAAARTTLNAHYTDAALVKAVWSSLSAAGFDTQAGGRVLEPGCGSGTFLGFAPGHVNDAVGIELDPTTAKIASLLYPTADIRSESFADTRLPVSSMDLAIGNVPFADVIPHDSQFNRDKLSLHNYFILKSLHLVRPGGVVAVLTSRWTMDSTKDTARQRFAEMADLVSAVRLPNRTHQSAAGTDVVTDLLVFRRRTPEETPLDVVGEWRGIAQVESSTLDDRGEPETVGVNRLFVDDPRRVLGQLSTRLGRFGPEVAVLPPDLGGLDDLPARVARDLARTLDEDLERYRQHRAVFTSPPSTALSVPGARAQGRGSPTPSPLRHQLGGANVPVSVSTAEGHISLSEDGEWFRLIEGALEPLDVPKARHKELVALCGIRDTLVCLLDVEATAPIGDEQEQSPAFARMEALRHQLNEQYDAYVDKFGPLNRISTRRTGRVNADGEPVVAQVRPSMGGFHGDPHSATVRALEDYDSATGTARKAAILTGRVVAPRTVPKHAGSPADAAALCLDTFGELRPATIAALLNVDVAQAEVDLEELAFIDPDSVKQSGDEWKASWVPRAEFLSGNVRVKLAQAVEVTDLVSAAPAGAARDTLLHRLKMAGDALRDVQPEDLGPTEIVAQLGVPWVPSATVEQFLGEILEDRGIQVEHPGGAVWSVRGNRNSVAARNTWGTDRVSAIDVAQACLEQRQLRVTDETPDGRRIPNETATFAAQEKAEAMQERFAQWLWEDPARCQKMVRSYNDSLNAIVLRSYDVDPHKKYDGMALVQDGRPLKLRAHQHAAVARMVAQPSVLLAHEVGAGKTLAAITGVSELRRLGLVRKPAVVVPNHMLEQFSREWLQAYPQARVLTCGTEDLVKDKRRLFIARAATGDWDAVIMSRSAFEKIPVSKETEETYLDNQMAELRRWLENSKADRGLSIKRLEGTLARAEERLKKLRDVERDPAVSFEATGIDYLCVDEAHGYKNLRLQSNIVGVSVDGSNRATDLDLKLSYLRERHGRRVATFLTATPIANSVAEAYTMLRYLAPADMEAAGIKDFDTWAATFGQVVTDLELSPSGSGFRMKARFAKFNNVPELLRLWHQVADVKTAADLDLPTPELEGGAAETVVVPPPEALVEFMGHLAKRADLVSARQVDPSEDNMLKISGHGRAAALDLRLIADGDPSLLEDPDREPAKLEAVADRVAQLYHAHADDVFEDDPERGALQLVFCDLGTPTGKGWNAYEELKNLLGERGVPEAKVRFMHEATNDRAKARLFEQARSGHVAVLIGSTEKMGMGTNVQRRAVALHHVDCPWRPADLAQRDGRIMRQGNLNPAVRIYRYVTEGSFDTYLWQTVERKERFIHQLMRGRLDVREIEDIGDSALSYAEVKALASGDPRIMELAKAETDTTKLERLERAWSAGQRSLAATVKESGPALEAIAVTRDQIHRALPLRRGTEGESFEMRINGTRVTKRADAAPLVQRALTQCYSPTGGPVPLGEVGGLSLQMRAERWMGEPRYVVSLTDVPRVSLVVEAADVREPSVGLVSRLENLPRRLDRILDDLDHEEAKITREVARAHEGLVDRFPRADELAAVRSTRDKLAAELAAEGEQEEATPPPPPEAAPKLAPGQAPTPGRVFSPPAPSAPPPPVPGTAPVTSGWCR